MDFGPLTDAQNGFRVYEDFSIAADSRRERVAIRQLYVGHHRLPTFTLLPLNVDLSIGPADQPRLR